MAGFTSAAIALGTAGYSIYQGAKQTKEAKKALNELDQQELSNVYESLPISTLGSDLLIEQAGRTRDSLVGGARQSGIRGVMSSIPRIQSLSNEQNQRAQLLLDNQVQSREMAIAEDNKRLQSMEEGRYNAELAGIGNMMSVGQQNTYSGIRGAANSLIYGASNIDFQTGPKVKDIYGEEQKVKSLEMPISTPNYMSSKPILGDAYKDFLIKEKTKTEFEEFSPNPYGLT